MSEKAEDKIRMSYEQRISELDDRLKEETSLRKKVEEELARIKKSLDSTSDAIGMSTPNGDHFYHNKAFSELFGFDTPEDLHAAGGGPVVYIDADVGREVFETIISGKSWSGEIEMASKSGRRIPVALRADAIKDEEGGIVGLIGVHTDITEQKKTELELLRILKAIESTSDAIGMSTPQGDHFFQNKAFSELFGFDTPEDLRTAGGGPVVYTDADVGREVFETIMSGKSWSGEIEMASKSGRRFPVALRADAIKDDEGKIIGLIGVHTDITERKKAEEELKRHRDHLEELVQERTEQLEVIQSQLIKTAHTAGQAEIATSVLHNVGNILNSVVTSSAMMMRTIEKSNSSKLVKANNLLRGNINNLDSFIQNDPKGKKLLDYYQMLENSLVQQDGTLLDQVNRIKEKIELIEAEIVAQQSYASGAVLTEEVFLQDVIVDAFQIKERSISKKNIQVEKRGSPASAVGS